MDLQCIYLMNSQPLKRPTNRNIASVIDCSRGIFYLLVARGWFNSFKALPVFFHEYRNFPVESFLQINISRIYSFSANIVSTVLMITLAPNVGLHLCRLHHLVLKPHTGRQVITIRKFGTSFFVNLSLF